MDVSIIAVSVILFCGEGLGFELRASHLQSRHSTTRTTPLVEPHQKWSGYIGDGVF
jgi:hypothetical protein